MRAIGLDVHRDFCEVAIVEDGVVRSAGRLATTPETLGLFARSLGREDRVAMEVTGNAWPAGHGAPDAVRDHRRLEVGADRRRRRRRHRPSG